MDFTAFSFGEALFIGLLYWICYLDIEFSWWFGHEIVLGIIFGFMYGNVTQGIQIAIEINGEAVQRINNKPDWPNNGYEWDSSTWGFFFGDHII